ncbi:MAG: 23S rRNA (adenine(2503)-C(2))-methyltransferase RlmN [Tindallia sp. MSAO_Bac2]|nr:MAG: 23S rRNA (adenine(2503)-C(2))-methyltransferase RlmN [Tindallia sp. MSAO_Bac2]
MASLEWPPYRANQIFQWIQKGCSDFAEMTNLSKIMRETLSKNYILTSLWQVSKQTSQDGTEKYLLELPDGELIETVLMRYKHGNSLCLSSQVGCAMGCQFCASGMEGLSRNLSAGEMLDQILFVSRDIKERISHVVMMGSGEPLQNLEEVVKLLNIINDKQGLNISLRHVTVSTCGLVPQIYELAEYKLPINLAISLHAASDNIRKSMMPIAERYSIDELLEACDAYVDKTNRRITYEYALVPGINDYPDEINKLAQKLKGKLCHVNLIPVNPVDDVFPAHHHHKGYHHIVEFLEKEGISATIRRELGADIDAACGQLKRRSKADL